MSRSSRALIVGTLAVVAIGAFVIGGCVPLPSAPAQQLSEPSATPQAVAENLVLSLDGLYSHGGPAPDVTKIPVSVEASRAFSIAAQTVERPWMAGMTTGILRIVPVLASKDRDTVSCTASNTVLIETGEYVVVYGTKNINQWGDYTGAWTLGPTPSSGTWQFRPLTGNTGALADAATKAPTEPVMLIPAHWTANANQAQLIWLAIGRVGDPSRRAVYIGGPPETPVYVGGQPLNEGQSYPFDTVFLAPAFSRGHSIGAVVAP